MKMIRSFLCFTLLCVFLFGQSTAETMHWHAELELLTAETAMKAEGDLVNNDSNSVFFTSILPEYRFISVGKEIQIPYNVVTDLNDLKSNPVFRKWINSLYTEESAGVYSGDSFDTALIKTEVHFTLRDLFSLLAGLSQNVNADEKEENHSNTLTILSFPEMLLSFNPIFNLKEFDQGRYYSLAGYWKENLFVTTSLNLDNNVGPYTVIGYAENGKNYYWSILMDAKDENETQYDLSLYADDYQTGFKTLGEDALIISMHWIVKNENTSAKRKVVFNAEILPANELTSVKVNGEFNDSEEGEMLQISAHFTNREKPTLRFQVYTDNKDVSIQAETRNTVRMDFITTEEQEKISAETNKIMDEWRGALIKSLPEDYILKMILSQ